MNIEQERADFEEWALEQPILMCLDNAWSRDHITGEYEYPIMEQAWRGYQAGRAALQSQYRKDVKRPVLDRIVDEIHRRADKEWADNGYDFEVTITADEYKALCEEEKAIDRAHRIEGD